MRTAAVELPRNSDAAKPDTTVARAAGSTSVAQVWSEECIDTQARPSRTVAGSTTAGARDRAVSRQAPVAAVPPSAMRRDAGTRCAIVPARRAKPSTATP
ncbi:hypothetical protein LUX57_32625 [Actinomadura madurae]|nr:hypothetical protein [Actinomadura madurae]MCP9969337.1 hypothetical protein [Actinomadura madurae]